MKSDEIPFKKPDFPLLFLSYSIIMKSNIVQGVVQVGELIAFLSGKGGTGKTSVCAGVATALAQAGERVLCIDCDIGLRNLDIALGLADHAALSFLDICEGRYRLDQAAAHPHFPSLFFLTAPINRSPAQINPTDFSRMLQQARSSFRYILLDAPAGVDAGFQLTAAPADRIVLVTGPDSAAIRDASRAGDLLELMGKTSVRLVVNRVHPKMVTTMNLTIDDIMDRAGLPLLGIVPEDSNVTLAASFGIPLLEFGKRGAAAACRRIAKRIQGMPEPITIR